jgi:predicted enzyme related to lactoylglutathione lyase
MVTRDTPWPDGTPCWVDIMTTDSAGAREFYGTLFGWDIEVGPPETGGYGMASARGRHVAGIGQLEGLENPPAWTTYLATSDVAATCAAIEAAGGTILAPPMQVMEHGSMAVVFDSAGAVFGLWQADQHTGVTLANEPNSLVWNELMTRDYEAAKAFYGSVFGWTFTDIGDAGFQYATVELNGVTVGGLGALPAEVPAEVPAHWRAYFAVANTDAALAQVEALGGSVRSAAQDTPYGRQADVADPQGALFAVLQLAEAPPA